MVVNGLSVLRLVGCILVLATAILCSNPPRLSAVMLTTWKDHKVFEASIRSAIRYMHEIDHFYVVTPNVQDFTKNLNLGSKVTFIHDNVFPFSFDNITNTMFDAVREKGRYNLTGETSFEKIVWGRWTWYLQQLIKLHAGRVLNLEDYLLLDSDLVWFRNVTFINHTDSQGITKYNYASSSQYHPPYMATLKRIAGVDIFDSSKNGGENVFRSGICHHMVIVKSVLEDLANSTERLHGNIPFWKVLLRESAFELTCRAPSEKICGAGSTLSEYELYFNFARVKHPETVAIRPLLWANGPMPGLQYWPNLDNPHSAVLTKHWDRERSAWFSHRMPHGESQLNHYCTMISSTDCW